MKKENIFTKDLNIEHSEPLINVDAQAFDNVISRRRSVRVFTPESIPLKDINKAIDHGLLAPNSSNLQPWEFHIVSSQNKKEELARYCFSQNGAKTASHLIVCVARTDTWKKHSIDMIKAFEKNGQDVPSVIEQYYKKIVPTAYGMMGPLGILSPLKWVFFNSIGLFRVMARGPIWPSDLKTWAVKSTALACENIMLSLTSMAHDTLAMEGYDEKKVKKMFKLNRKCHVVMVIAVGKRSEKGIYGPQARFPREWFVHNH